MYVSEVIAIPIILQTRLSKPETTKFRSDLLKKTISSITTIKNLFCRKSKATTQNLRK